MKRIFGHTKRPIPARRKYTDYDEREYDWDSIGEEDADENTYYEEESEENGGGKGEEYTGDDGDYPEDEEGYAELGEEYAGDGEAYDEESDTGEYDGLEEEDADSEEYDGLEEEGEDSEEYDGLEEEEADSEGYDGLEEEEADSEEYDGLEEEEADSEGYDGLEEEGEDSEGYYGLEEAEEYLEEDEEYTGEAEEYLEEDEEEYAGEAGEYPEDEEYAGEEEEYPEDEEEYAGEAEEYLEDEEEYAENKQEYCEESDSEVYYGFAEEGTEIGEYPEDEEYLEEAEDYPMGQDSEGYSEGAAHGSRSGKRYVWETARQGEDDEAVDYDAQPVVRGKAGRSYREARQERYQEEPQGYYGAGRRERYGEGIRGDSEREGREARTDRSFITRLGDAVRGMSLMDRMMAVTSIAVLVLAIVVVCTLLSAKTVEKQVADFSSVGKELEGIAVIGEKGLAAVANAQTGKQDVAVIPPPDSDPEPTEEPKKDYDEKDYNRQVSVETEFISIQKDLKIKFINSKTSKLVANVPFSVSVVDPDGAKFIWSDDDMDGIILKKDIKPGKYKVTLEALTDSKYADYTLSTLARTVEVKKEIVYNKVDVANEIKTEKEVDVAKEDTKKNETVVESSLTDTVAWVESKILEAVYNEVSKSTIPDPVTLAAGSRALQTMLTLVDETEETESSEPSASEPSEPSASEPSEPSASEPSEPSASESSEPSASESSEPPASESSEPPASESSEPSASESSEPPASEPTAEPTAEPSESPTPEPSESPTPEPTATPTPEPTVTPSPSPAPAKGTLTVDNSYLTGVVGTALKAKATASGFTEGRELVYDVSSGAETVATATVDAQGNISITPVNTGTAVITVTANYKGGDSGTAAAAYVTVVVGGKKTLTLNKTALTVFVGVTGTVDAKIENALLADPVVTAESWDTNVATVSVNKRTVTITGMAAGTVNVTVKYAESGEEVTAVCTVTVKPHPSQDKSTLLKDKDGVQLYVLENGVYREAVNADYYTAEKFFVKEAAKYTGWQTIGGKVYYYTAEGKAVTGEQVIQGAKYNFASDGSLVVGSGVLGIDVSKWNGNINWEAVKNSGVSYVIIRCGYRGSAQGQLIEDPKFQANIKGANAAGIKVGVYFFSQAVDEAEAVEEASMVLGQIKGYTISYPVFIDVEASGGRGDAIDKGTRTAVCKAFCQTIQNGGYTAGVYSNKYWLENNMDAGSLSAYKIWLAQYAATPTYAGRYDLWQYRSTGNVSGISGNVDMNISYLGY